MIFLLERYHNSTFKKGGAKPSKAEQNKNKNVSKMN